MDKAKKRYTKLNAQGNALSDSASSWSMVKDNVTGLIWEMKTNDGSIHDKKNMYNWDDAQSVFIATLNAEKFGGFSDWRRPMDTELFSIRDSRRFNPAINTAYFPNTISSYYWSLTPYAGYYIGNAWCVDFDDGSLDYGAKSSKYYVRAVRGGNEKR